jgi:hypothetical protein
MLPSHGQRNTRDASAKARMTPLVRSLVTFTIPPMTAHERKLSRFLLFLEDVVKVPLFGCQRCGECILSSTAFICSQNCPKRLRNGPCGGTGEGGSCEVFPDRKCVWYRIYVRSSLLHRVSLLYTMNSIHDWSLEKTSAWLNLFRGRIQGTTLFVRNDVRRVKDIIADDARNKA